MISRPHHQVDHVLRSNRREPVWEPNAAITFILNRQKGDPKYKLLITTRINKRRGRRIYWTRSPMQLHGRQGNTNELSSQIGNGFLRNGRVRPQGDEFREKPPISFHDRASPVPDPFATSPSFHQEDIRRSFDPTRDLPALPDGGEEGEKKCGDPLPLPGRRSISRWREGIFVTSHYFPPSFRFCTASANDVDRPMGIGHQTRVHLPKHHQLCPASVRERTADRRLECFTRAIWHVETSDWASR